jgi:hypothetical protein
MTFPYSSTGIEPSEGFKLIPPDRYVLEIENAVEGVTKNGDPKVTVDYKVSDGPHKGSSIRYHNVSFLPVGAKGAGIAVHYLKSIGEPWEGDFKVNCQHWIGKKLIGTVVQEKDLKGVMRNVVRFVDPLEVSADSDVPF